MKKFIVKRGFDYEKIYYGAGKEVSEEIAKIFPDFVKGVGQEVVEVREDVKENVSEPESVVLPDVQPEIEKKPVKKKSRK
jgi:hypothetical protein